ncbi:MAG TPA: serine hydrolase [Vicinamibacterales bacterium]|nr:serine hydrolase [Vicinamibacterales bacterium]
MRKHVLPVAIAAAVSIALTAVRAATAQPAVAPDAEITKIIADRIDVQKQSVGIVVGVIESSGRRVVSHGALAKGDARPLSGDTLFEIGSITKVFTSLLLAEAVERHEVALADPVAKYLPDTAKVPERGGRAITLQDLATHTSALPRMPTNFTPADPANPYADYSVAQLYQFLASYQLTRDIGSQYEYSNLGGGLLGHALALRAHTDYASLVRERITAPLGMTSTAIVLSPELKARLAVGHNPALQPVANWDLPTLAGAGALRSTTNDLLTFLSANLGYTNSTLAPAMAAMLTVRRPTGSTDLEIALGWHVLKTHGREIVWHNGGTAGYRTFIGFDRAARTGVVVLSNAGTPAGPDDIGRHLLDPGAPLLQAPAQHTETKVDPKIYDQYAGRYQLAPSMVMTVTRAEDHLFAQLTGQPRFEIFPEGEKQFFFKVVDAQLTFETDAQGKATAAVLHQNGLNQRAPRIEGEPVAPKEITVDPAVLDRYAGRYQLTPAATLTLSRDGAKFYVQLTGQPRFELFASGEREFFLKVVDAQLTMEVDASGKAAAVTLHQFGRDQRAPRVE